MISTKKSEKIKNEEENDKNEYLEESKGESDDNISTPKKNLDDKEIILENNDIKKHQRCVPLEIYTKVYQDKQTLLNQVELLNQEINSLNNAKTSKLKDENEILKSLNNKYKNLQREKTNIEEILLNQENYVDKLKKKIEKLERQIFLKNEEIIKKENNILELNDKIEELNNKINTMKQAFKLNEKKEIIKLNDRILSLINEIELKQNRIDFINKRHKHLQIKYLKLLGEKSKITQDLIPLSKQSKEKDIFSEINSTTGSKHMDTIKSYTSIKKTENNNANNNKNKKIKKGKRDFSFLNIKLYKDLNLPEIRNKTNKEKYFKKNKDLKDTNYLLSDYSDREEENKYNNEKEEVWKDDTNKY